MVHGDALFTTLTYDDDQVPKSLSKRHLQLFLKKLRRRMDPHKIRYFACGEYGEEEGRPHYHALLYGVSHWHIPLIEESWGKGFVYNGEVNEKTINYVTGYILKSEKRGYKDGRLKEFRVMSRNPGIGGRSLTPDANAFNAAVGSRFQDGMGMPEGIRIGGARHPIGRYLNQRLRRIVDGPVQAAEAAARLNRLAADNRKYGSTSQRLELQRRARIASEQRAVHKFSIRKSLRTKAR